MIVALRATRWLPLSHPVREEHVDVVTGASSDVWEKLGRQLEFTHTQVLGIVSAIKYERPRDSDRLYLIIKVWQDKMGRKATLGKLLEACHKVEKGGEILSRLAKQLPKITELTVCSTERIITGGILNIVCSKTLAETRRSPISCCHGRNFAELTETSLTVKKGSLLSWDLDIE